MVAMFNTQQGGAAPTGQQPTTGKPTGLFSAGNAFGQAAGTAYNNTANYLQSNPLNYSAAPALPGVNDFSGDRQRIEQALLGRATTQLDTRYRDETAAFEQRMANEGVDIGSDRYRKEKEAFERDRGEAYNDATFRAMLAGGDEQTRLFGLALKAREQAVTEADALHASRLSDMAALLNPALKIEELLNDKAIADQTNETNRYGIDSVANTANLDRASRDQNAQRTDATERFGIRTSAKTSAAERRARAREEAKRRAQERRENERNRNLTRSEGAANRQVTREGLRRRGGGGGVQFTPEDDIVNTPPGTGGQ
jgi:hypothetical protein